MHETLKKLYRDHAHFYKLMDLLEQQLDQIKQQGEVPISLLLELVDYTRHYADGIHHPIEDHLYQRALVKTDESRDDMEKLLGHHQIIMQMTRELRQALETQDAAEVEKTGRDYLDHQRSHMAFEEEKAFPLLRRVLDAGDFEYASQALPAEEDPLLDPNLWKGYPELHKAMSQE